MNILLYPSNYGYCDIFLIGHSSISQYHPLNILLIAIIKLLYNAVFFIQFLQFLDWLQLAKNREWIFSSNATPTRTVSSFSTFFFSLFVTFKRNI